MNPTPDALRRLVKRLFPGARLLRAWPLSGGISAGMTALEIELPGDESRKVVLRQESAAALQHNPRCAEEEFRVLRAVHSLGLAVPAPLHFESAGQVFPAPCMVIEYIDGHLDFSPPDIAHYARQAAQHLARLHRAEVSRLDLSFLPRQIRDIPETMTSPPRQDTGLDGGRIRQILQEHWPVPPINPPALLHGDYWPGNLLWQDDQLAAVIDWEDAALGDPLSDLSIARLDLLWILGREAMEAFTQEYLYHNPLDLAYLPHWDLAAALRLSRLVGEDLAEWAAFFHPYGRTDITEQSIREQFRYFVEQAAAKIAPGSTGSTGS